MVSVFVSLLVLHRLRVTKHKALWTAGDQQLSGAGYMDQITLYVMFYRTPYFGPTQ